jgi:hypothetical protein
VHQGRVHLGGSGNATDGGSGIALGGKLGLRRTENQLPGPGLPGRRPLLAISRA